MVRKAIRVLVLAMVFVLPAAGVAQAHPGWHVGTNEPGYHGWAQVSDPGCRFFRMTLDYCRARPVTAYEWTGSGWRQIAFSDQDWVYVYPYTGEWRWAWDRLHGWTAIRADSVVFKVQG